MEWQDIENDDEKKPDKKYECRACGDPCACGTEGSLCAICADLLDKEDNKE